MKLFEVYASKMIELLLQSSAVEFMIAVVVYSAIIAG